MGYSTDFEGQFDVTPTLKLEHAAYLKKFNETRRMRRNGIVTESFPDPTRIAAGLPIGVEGEYYVGAGGFMGQDSSPDVIEYNTPPFSQPSLWCQWRPTDDGTAIVWDQGEKFYSYIPWLVYQIDRFFLRWGYTLNGVMAWRGEDSDDIGIIIIKDNIVTTYGGRESVRRLKEAGELRQNLLKFTEE